MGSPDSIAGEIVTGAVSEEQLDASVKRILTMKYNLGQFDKMGQKDIQSSSLG